MSDIFLPLGGFVGTTTGTGSALIATIGGANLSDFVNVQVKLHTDIEDGATFNLNGLGAKPILLNTGENITSGAVAGAFLNLIYNTASGGAWYLLDNVAAIGIPDGSTLTPVDVYKTWLKCAAISDVYGSLQNVIADSTAMNILVNNINALRYMVRSVSTIMPAVLADSNWVSALDSSIYASHVPTMTSATTPSGVVSASFEKAELGYPGWKAFDKNNATGWSYVNGTLPITIQYRFATAVAVYKMYFHTYGSIYAPASYKISYSDNGTNWSDIGTYSNTLQTVTKLFTGSTTAHLYWRVTVLSFSSGSLGEIDELDFYGLDLS